MKILLSVIEFINKKGGKDPLIILPYMGYASEETLFMKGRVLEDENIYRGKSNSKFRNLINSFKRFETDEVANASVRLTIEEQVFETKSDDEGYFTIDEKWIPPTKNLQNSWIPVSCTLLDYPKSTVQPGPFIGEILIPSTEAAYGVITDIDDTILQTHVSSRFKLKMLYTTFLKNARQRLPMEGTVSLFQAFVRGADGLRQNPIFYLSHSPWNIYDLLEEFLELQQFPKGPILLRDYGLNPSGEFAQHKLSSIEQILSTYPNLPFILLGDSAEKDADFYIDVATRFPGRVKAIYIRQTKNNRNARRVKALIEKNSNANAVIINSSAEISEHAILQGLIHKSKE